MSELKVTEVMRVELTKDTPAAHWGKADVTFNAEGALVHLGGGDELRQIQMAARKLRNQGISTVALAGALWDLNSQWVFAQGFATAKPGYKIQWCGDDAVQAELQRRLEEIGRAHV